MKLLRFSRCTWPYLCLYLFFSTQLQELHSESNAPVSTTNENPQTGGGQSYVPESQHKKSTSYSLAAQSHGLDIRDFRKKLGDLTN